ncbi:MAG: hypothetical protein AB1801_20570, partial [Chloroflexota bacterium]
MAQRNPSPPSPETATLIGALIAIGLVGVIGLAAGMFQPELTPPPSLRSLFGRPTQEQTGVT